MRSPFARAARPECRLKKYARPSFGLCDVAMSCCRRHKEGCWHREQSRVNLALHRFEQLLYIVVTERGRQSQFPWHHHEWFAVVHLGCHQAKAEKVVDGCFKSVARAAHLLGQQTSNIVIQRKCCSHIMMLTHCAS